MSAGGAGRRGGGDSDLLNKILLGAVPVSHFTVKRKPATPSPVVQ